MPPLCAADPRPAVLHWLSEKKIEKDKDQRPQNKSGSTVLFMALKNIIARRMFLKESSNRDLFPCHGVYLHIKYE